MVLSSGLIAVWFKGKAMDQPAKQDWSRILAYLSRLERPVRTLATSQGKSRVRYIGFSRREVEDEGGGSQGDTKRAKVCPEKIFWH